MSARIADLREAHAPQGITISRVRDANSISHFARINAENWTPPDPLVERYFERAAGRLVGPGSPLRFYVARLDGEPVAGVEIALGGAGVGVFNLSTLRTHRRLGIGGALMTRALLESAREAGARKAVLQAAPAAARLYGRIGFSSFGPIRELKPVHSV